MEPQTPYPSPSTVTGSVPTWDVPTRLFHWLLVIALVGSWPSFEYAESLGDPTLQWHRYNGYAILVLIMFRLIWGFVGSSTSRWSMFVRWPWHAVRYGFDLAGGRDRKFLGHNPLGAYMILALLLVVAGQAALGLFVTEHNETTWGPLADWVPEAQQKSVRRWHIAGFYWVVLPLAILHVLANTLYGFIKRDPLVRAMVSGRKPAEDYEDARAALIDRDVMRRAAGVLVLSAVIVGGAIMSLGGKLFY